MSRWRFASRRATCAVWTWIDLIARLALAELMDEVGRRSQKAIAVRRGHPGDELAIAERHELVDDVQADTEVIFGPAPGGLGLLLGDHRLPLLFSLDQREQDQAAESREQECQGPRHQ